MVSTGAGAASADSPGPGQAAALAERVEEDIHRGVGSGGEELREFGAEDDREEAALAHTDERSRLTWAR